MKLERKKKWLYLGIGISILNPLIGAILGVVLLKTEPGLEKEGKNTLIAAVVVVVLYLIFARSVGSSLGMR